MNTQNFCLDNWSCDRGIKCPVCGYEYSHISRITRTDANVNIGATCEAGHNFMIRIFEHKGKIFFETEVIKHE